MKRLLTTALTAALIASCRTEPRTAPTREMSEAEWETWDHGAQFPDSMVDVVHQADWIADVRLKTVKDGLLPVVVVRSVKGEPLGKPDVFRIDGSDSRGAVLAQYFKGFFHGGIEEVPGMLFARTLQDGETKWVVAFLRVMGDWWHLQRMTETGEWWFDRQVTVTASQWDGSTEMLRRCVDYILKAGPKADYPVNGRAEWHKRVQVGRAPAKVHGLMVVDLHGDGARALFVLSDGGDRVFERADGKREFRDVTASLKLASRSLAAVLADFNADGRLDLASWDGRRLSLWMQSAEGTFEKSQASLMLEKPCLGLSVIDVGVKGIAGILVSTERVPMLVLPQPDGSLHVRDVVQLAKGERLPSEEEDEAVRFGPEPREAAALKRWLRAYGRPQACVVADFDGDGWPDILQPYERGGLFYKGMGGGEFQAPRSAADPVGERRRGRQLDISVQSTGTLYSGEGPAAVHTGDFDADGRLDVIFVTKASDVCQWRNMTSGRFAGPYPMGQLDYVLLSNQAGGAVGDTNNDGREDFLLLGGYGRDEGLITYLFLNHGFSMFSWSWPFFDDAPVDLGKPVEGPPAAWGGGLFADLDDDGAQDIVLALEDGTVWVVFQEVETGRGLCVRADLAPKGGSAGPVIVTGWADGRCLGARNVVPGTAEAFFGRRTPGTITLRWRFPGGPERTADVRVKDGPVRVLLGPDGLEGGLRLHRARPPLAQPARRRRRRASPAAPGRRRGDKNVQRIDVIDGRSNPRGGICGAMIADAHR